MKSDLSVLCLDDFPCAFFLVGKVEITPNTQELFDDSEIVVALRRHTHRDFGEVSWEHFNGNLQLIAESHGVITSVYTGALGKQLRIATRLDSFDPRTRIFTV